MVPLPWLKPTVMVYYHPSGTQTKHVASQERNGLPCMTLNTGYPHRDLSEPLTMQKPDMSRVALGLW